MKIFYYVELAFVGLSTDFLLGVILISLGMYPQAVSWETTLGKVMFEPSVLLFSIGVLLFAKPYVRNFIFKDKKKFTQGWSYMFMALGAILFTLTTGGGLLEKCESNHDDSTFRQRHSFSNDAFKQVEKVYTDFAHQMNSQTPIRIDEITTLQSVAFINRNMSMFYKVDAYCSDFTEEEIEDSKVALKAAQKDMAKKMFASGNYDLKASDLSEMMKETGIKWRFLYRDLNDELLFEIFLDYTDF